MAFLRKATRKLKNWGKLDIDQTKTEVSFVMMSEPYDWRVDPGRPQRAAVWEDLEAAKFREMLAASVLTVWLFVAGPAVVWVGVRDLSDGFMSPLFGWLMAGWCVSAAVFGGVWLVFLYLKYRLQDSYDDGLEGF